MEEQKKEEVTEQENAAVTEGENAAAGDSSADAAPAGLPKRSFLLMTLAGFYLLYTGYKLCKNVMDGVEGASMGFMLAGIAFLAIGAGMLFVGGRGIVRADKMRQAQEAASAAQQAAAPADTQQEEKAPAAKLSISERARLTGRLEDEEEEQL